MSVNRTCVNSAGGYNGKDFLSMKDINFYLNLEIWLHSQFKRKPSPAIPTTSTYVRIAPLWMVSAPAQPASASVAHPTSRRPPAPGPRGSSAPPACREMHRTRVQSRLQPCFEDLQCQRHGVKEASTITRNSLQQTFCVCATWGLIVLFRLDVTPN